VSAAEARPGPIAAPSGAATPPGLQLAICAADIVEFAALRGGADAVRAAVRTSGLELPEFGRMAVAPGRLALSIRPDRWLVLGAQTVFGEAAASWQRLIGAAGAAIDQSSGFDVLQLRGPALREVLARGCRLDLDPGVRPCGDAVATVIAQVPATLAIRRTDILLLTPSSTAQHVREWLAATALYDGFESRSTVSLDELLTKEIA
jgi:heterotetrameric sarcosine oxidase gamma subunit